ncbi:MAG: hypothetical protein EOP87_00270 [Verrucomicrobiaceae bacterium]|nr:MAG: hypothetical protein EOP87_00270 [Verrucomicrobiaceae bacterium]
MSTTQTEPPTPNLTTEDAAMFARVMKALETENRASFDEDISEHVIRELRKRGILAEGKDRIYYDSITQMPSIIVHSEKSKAYRSTIDHSPDGYAQEIDQLIRRIRKAPKQNHCHEAAIGQLENAAEWMRKEGQYADE